MQTVNGTFDGEKIITDSPIEAPPNTRVVVMIVEDSAPSPKSKKLSDLIGCANYAGPPKTLQEMEEGIRKGAEESMKWCQ